MIQPFTASLLRAQGVDGWRASDDPAVHGGSPFLVLAGREVRAPESGVSNPLVPTVKYVIAVPGCPVRGVSKSDELLRRCKRLPSSGTPEAGGKYLWGCASCVRAWCQGGHNGRAAVETGLSNMRGQSLAARAGSNGTGIASFAKRDGPHRCRTYQYAACLVRFE